MLGNRRKMAKAIDPKATTTFEGVRRHRFVALLFLRLLPVSVRVASVLSLSARSGDFARVGVCELTIDKLMKRITKGAFRSASFVIATATAILASNVNTFAIEGLTISVQCPNVVLGWPSNPGENYIVQWRPTLDLSTPWVTLTNSLPADWSTNWTFFVHSNVVQCGSGGSGGGSGGSPPSPSVASSVASTSLSSSLNAASASSDAVSSEPMAMRADGVGDAMPVRIFPPGFDLSAFIIFDPDTGERVSGRGYVVRETEANVSRTHGPQPMDGPTGGSSGPDPGYYQVVKEGVQIWNTALTNLTAAAVSNVISIQFEAGNDTGDLEDVTLLVDGIRYRGVTPLIAPAISGPLQVDTSFLENGDHTFQVMVGWRLPDGSDINNDSVHAYSDPLTLTVSNVIYFPDWEEEIGELGFAFYSFKTTCTNADWRIDVYDVSNNLAKTLTGHTADGVVETNWNLVDIHGATRATNENDSEFSAVITVADPVTKKPPTQKKGIAYPAHGQWAIAYQDAFGNMANSNAYWHAINSFGGMAAQFGGAHTVLPSSNPTNGQTFPLRYAWTNNPSPPTIAQKLADETALVGLLTNAPTRNFFYCGHGSGSRLVSIDLDALRYVYLNKHYYRFVYLKGCSTATGALPAAFGNNCTSAVDLSYFQKHGIRPRTFLGNNQDVFFANSGNYFDSDTGQTYTGGKVADRVIDFLNNFEFYWYFNYDITSAIYNAENDTPDLRTGWDDGPNLLLFGYQWLYIDQYNYQSDWQN